MKHFFKLFLIITFLNASTSFAQETTEEETTVNTGREKSFKMGLFIGSYFANKYTASAYDGNGYDLNGDPHTSFEESYMNQKINLQYGGGYVGSGGVLDPITTALGLNARTDWVFEESDMPSKMRYNPAFIVGLQSRYSVDKKNSIVINLNVAKITASGNFTITTRPPSGSTQMNSSFQTFGIQGTEQRLMIQLGYNRILGNHEKINFFAEGGLNVTYSQLKSNKILINNLSIDLMEVYDDPLLGVQAGYTTAPRGFGYGLYGGAGLNVDLSDKYLIQVIYSPSLEGIKVVESSGLKLQQSVGVRMYYNF